MRPDSQACTAFKWGCNPFRTIRLLLLLLEHDAVFYDCLCHASTQLAQKVQVKLLNATSKLRQGLTGTRHSVVFAPAHVFEKNVHFMPNLGMRKHSLKIRIFLRRILYVQCERCMTRRDHSCSQSFRMALCSHRMPSSRSHLCLPALLPADLGMTHHAVDLAGKHCLPHIVWRPHHEVSPS